MQLGFPERKLEAVMIRLRKPGAKAPLRLVGVACCQARSHLTRLVADDTSRKPFTDIQGSLEQNLGSDEKSADCSLDF